MAAAVGSAIRSLACLAIAAVALGCGGGASHADAPVAPPNVGEVWLIGPTPGEDFLRATATHDALLRRFGPAAVRLDSIYVGEGSFEKGSVLFPDDSTRRLEILWGDSVGHTRPRTVFISSGRSGWRIYPGVQMGTPLSVVDSLNGRPISLYGFAWDYSGTVASFEHGRLDALWNSDSASARTVVLRLGADSVPARLQALYNTVIGERVYRSSHPAMRALNPRVYQILITPR